MPARAPDPAPTLVGAQTEAAYQHASAMTNSPALTLTVEARSGRARTCKLQLPHFVAETPMFMPVGTQGSIKGLTTEQVEELDCHVILGNTYHLGLRPGAEVMDQLGGLHRFMNWNRGLLTDSGGFQMVSLLKLADITEEGVNFQSPVDGTHLLLTPEKSMEIQNSIEADIMMALDDVVPATANNPTRTEEATHRTLRWMRRCIAAHKKPHVQNLFGIIQGGFDRDLRSYCIKEMVNLNLPGYAIGGISGGEEKSLTWQVVDQCTALLPENKPKYCMGIGYPVDLVCFVALGTDMFDCVYPSRTARFGTAMTPEGLLNLTHAKFATDFRPVDETCSCYVCSNYTRAYLHTVAGKDSAGGQLLTYHNIAYLMSLMRQMREAIKDGSFPAFVQSFMDRQFPNAEYPAWVVDALSAAGISLSRSLF